MQELLTKLAEIATKLDESGHREQADKIDDVMMQLASELHSTAAPFMGGGNLTEEDLARLQGDESVQPQQQAPQGTQLPPSASDKIVMRSKTPDAQGYGFFTTRDIENAVKEGKVDASEATRAIQQYLRSVGYNLISQTLPELIQSLVANSYLPLSGKAPEVYGAKKSVWQKLFGK